MHYLDLKRLAVCIFENAVCTRCLEIWDTSLWLSECSAGQAMESSNLMDAVKFAMNSEAI